MTNPKQARHDERARMRLQPLQIPLAPDLAGRVAACLAAACARLDSDLAVDELLTMCAAGQAQLVGIFDGDRFVAAGVTQVRQHAGGRLACWVLSLGGSAAGPWGAVIAAVERGAARLGCSTVEFVGRRGWARVLPDYAAAPCELGTHFVKQLARDRAVLAQSHTPHGRIIAACHARGG